MLVILFIKLIHLQDKRFNICFECALPIKLDESKVDFDKEKSSLDTSKTKMKTGNIKSKSKLATQKDMGKSILDDKTKSKLMMQKNIGKSILDNRQDDDESSTLFDNMDNFLCPICELVRFCNMTCLRINVDKVNCHPCSKCLKAQYFPNPVGAE